MKFQTFSLFFFIFFISNNLFSQAPTVAIEQDDFKVLYRGYSNRIRVAVSNADGQTFILKSNELEIKKTDVENLFIVKPIGRHKKATISVFLTNNGDTSKIRSIDYRLSNPPYPNLYWGGSKENSSANIKANRLCAKYPPEIPLKSSFRIIKWELSVDSARVMSSGSNLNKAETLLKSISEPKEVFIQVYYVGPDGITRRMERSWHVKPWDETKEPEVINILD